jgi:3-oxoacyl-[acyl-carrier-protein] synthase II
MNRRVVVTGVGAVTPLGVGASTLHERWAAGQVGIDGGDARCDEFDAEAHLGKKQVRRTDRFAQLALASSDEALEQAGWSAGDLPYDSERIGCVIGTGIGGIGTIESQHDVLRDRGAKLVSPLSVPLLMANAGAGQVAMRHGLEGQSFGITSACAAGAHAIGTAARMIQCGDADAVVTGGTESALGGLARAAFAAMGATSELGISRPFDARRDGFVMGEGAGILVLEDAEAAEARGATIVGELLGYGASSDAHHITAPKPDGSGSARAIRAAMRDAGIDASQIDYVNAHGTSTPLNDAAETAALIAGLGDDDAHRIPVSSTKSAIGHLLGAAGAVEAIATLLALRERVAPPTLGYEEPDEGLDLDYVPGKARELVAQNGRLVGMSNSFGFGGHNAVLVMAA